MYKIIIIVLVFIASALPLSAQSDWSGFYLGGNGFATSDKSDAAATLSIQQISNLRAPIFTVVPGTTRDFAASERKTNGGGGGQAGYQWQSGGFVFGAEGDFNPFHRTFSVSQSFQIPPTILTPTVTINAQRDIRLSRELSIRVRIGGAFGKTLIYGTGGYTTARARVSSIDSYTNPGGAAAGGFNSGAEGPVVTTNTSSSKNMNGWNLGFGLDQKLGKRFSLGFEYRHTDFGSKTFAPGSMTTVNTGPETRGTDGATGLLGSVSTGPTSVSLKSDSFGVRFNFHF